MTTSLLRSSTPRAGYRWLAALLLAGLLAPAAWLALPPAPGQPAARCLAPPTGRPAVAHAPIPADTSAPGMAAIWADVRRRSYHLAADAGPAAPRRATNVAQRLTARLAPAAYTLAAAVPLKPAADSAAAPAWQVELALRGIGRAGQPGLPLAAAPTVAAATDTSVCYQHGRAFAVEYLNTPAGLRQNYYLHQRPAGATGPVRVQLALTTALHATATPDGQAIRFAPAGGGVAALRYGGLRAWDATGRVLPSRLRLHGTTALALEVDDAGATYPVTIDPLASTTGTTLTGPSAAAAYATSVALTGDLNGDGYGDVAVGAPGASGGAGAVYVYPGSSSGPTSVGGNVVYGPGGSGLGGSVAGASDFNGDGYADLLVGCPSYNGNQGTLFLLGGGAAFFSNPLGAYGNVSGPGAGARYGAAVAGVGDINADGYADVAIGAPGTSTGAGGYTVFYGNASLSLNTYGGFAGNTGEQAGTSVAGLGDTNGDGYADLAVGAPGSGSVIVIRGVGGTNFANTTRFKLTPGGSGAGSSVAGPGDVDGDGYPDLLVGAPGAGPAGTTYLYRGSPSLATGTAPVATLTGATAADAFGTTVSGAGDVNADGYADFAVGAPGYASGSGRTYVYQGTGTAGTFTTPQTFDGAAGSKAGSSLSGGDTNGDGYGDLLVAAPGSASLTGTAALYYGRPAPVAATPSLSLANPSGLTNEYFGISVSGAGDVNADGYADVVVGAYGANSLSGAVYQYLGSASGFGTGAGTTAGTYQRLDNPTGAADEYFGWSVSGAGDVNGDGYADVVIGAYGANNIRGSAYLYRGSATGLVNAAGTTAGTYQRLNYPGTAFDYYAFNVAGAGDVNADGYADFLVGAYGTRAVYLYLGSSGTLGTGVGTTAGTYQRLNSPNAGSDNFGRALAGAGDVNGDGYADVIIGAFSTTSGRGSALLYLGSSGGLGATAGTAAGTYQLLANPNGTGIDNFGSAVAGAGDVNGDSYADVLIGAKGPGAGGSTYLCLGSYTGLTTTSGTTAGTTQRLDNPNNTGGDEFGLTLAGAGDVNGDGYADVIVGARNTDNGGTNRGSAYLYLGSATALGTSVGTTAGTYQRFNDPANVDNDGFGQSVAGVGDLSGDGYADVLIGAWGASSYRGATYLYRGNEGVARPGGRLRFYNADLTTPLQAAANRPATQFGIGFTSRSVLGRTRARLVWEAVGQHRPFSSGANGSPATSVQASGRGPWTDLGTSGTELKALVSKVGRTSRVRARLEYASAALASGSTAAGTGGGAGSGARYGPWQYTTAQQLSQLNAQPLPVELTVFTATAEGPAAVRLAWATASEKNSAAFEVERSADGVAFERIGTVPAAGSSRSARRYELLDAGLPAGAARLYYRLRQVDADGTFSYSPVRAVALSRSPIQPFTAYPNPAHGAVTAAGLPAHAPVEVLDALGRPVARATADAAGTARLVLPAGLAAGVYIVRSGTQARRLTVE